MLRRIRRPVSFWKAKFVTEGYSQLDLVPHIHSAVGVGNGSTDEEGQRVWPGQESVLLPPTFHHQIHIEAQHKGHGYALALLAKILSDLVENPAKGYVRVRR